jgi:hypothetical protein
MGNRAPNCRGILENVVEKRPKYWRQRVWSMVCLPLPSILGFLVTAVLVPPRRLGHFASIGAPMEGKGESLCHLNV